MKVFIRRTWVAFLASFLTSATAGCVVKQKSPQTKLAENQEVAKDTPQEVEIAIARQFSPVVLSLFNALAKMQSIHEYNLKLALDEIGAKISPTVEFSRSQGLPDPISGVEPPIQTTVYCGFQLGSRIFVLKQNFGPQVTQKYWTPVAAFASTIYASQPGGGETSIDYRVREYLKTKVSDVTDYISLTQSINTIDFIAHFIPGYGGIEKVVNSSTSGAVFMGVVEYLGDTASLGLGSKVKIIKEGAAAIVVVAGTARISAAAKQAYDGTATWNTGIDAFLATVETGLASVTFIKLRVSGAKAIITNADEAAVIGQALGRKPEEILQNGLNADDLRRIGVAFGKVGDDALEAGKAWIKQLSSCIQGLEQGVGLSLEDATDEFCQLLAKYAESRLKHGFEYGWIKHETYQRLNADAGPDARKKFLAAIQKGYAESAQNATGIKSLDLSKPHPNLPPGYTHELKIAGSGARLLGKIEKLEVGGKVRQVVVFDRFAPAGLH